MPLPELHFLPLSRDLDVSAFRCGHTDLDEFLIEDSREHQEERLSVTHLAYIDSELVGFFTLVTDCIDVKQVAPEDGKRGLPLPEIPGSQDRPTGNLLKISTNRYRVSDAR